MSGHLRYNPIYYWLAASAQFSPNEGSSSNSLPQPIAMNNQCAEFSRGLTLEVQIRGLSGLTKRTYFLHFLQ